MLHRGFGRCGRYGGRHGRAYSMAVGDAGVPPDAAQRSSIRVVVSTNDISNLPEFQRVIFEAPQGATWRDLRP
jgi:hypothetical protein